MRSFDSVSLLSPWEVSSTEAEPEITQASRRATGRITTKVPSSSVARSVAQSRQSGGPTPVKEPSRAIPDVVSI
jgi:hypothetical protein